jgi:hypothetical protein
MMKKRTPLTHALTASCLLTLAGCQRELAVIDDSVGTDNSDLARDNDAGSPSGSEGTAEPITTDCSCAQSPSLRALTCGSLIVPLGTSDNLIATTADGSIVAFNLEKPDAPGDYTVAYWQAGSGTSRAGRGRLIGMDGAGNSLAMLIDATCSADGNCVMDVKTLDTSSGESQVLRIGQTLYKNTFSRDGMSLLGKIVENDIEYLARATRGGSVERLAPLGEYILPDGFGTYATPNGATIVGRVYKGTPDYDLFDGMETTADRIGTAFRWTEAGGLLIGLGELPSGIKAAQPEVASDDGAVVAGYLEPADPDGLLRGFRWTESTGLVVIGGARGRTFLSADGTVQVSNSTDGTIYRWQEATGAVDLFWGDGIGMSEDGNVIAAQAGTDDALGTIIWDSTHGKRYLYDLLERQGVDLSNWSFDRPRLLSRNGKVLLGDAFCNGAPTLYRIELPD